MSKRARLIYNPSSGREIIKKSLSDIIDVYENAGYETSAFRTTPEVRSAQNEAKRAAEAQFDLIIAAGGDGTINEVINGVAPLRKRPKLAILPAGTTNDFARALQIPRNNFIDAAKLIEKEQSIDMDIGQVQMGDNVRYFVNIGAAGSLTELTYDVPPQLKSLFGSIAYFVKGAELLPQIGNVPIRVSYDEGEYEGNASMVFVAMTNSVGGFEKIAPDSMLGDGKFTLIIVKTTNLVEIMRLVTLILNDGRHVNNPNIIYTKTSKVDLETLNDDRLMINLDGEYGGDAPAQFINIQKHIDFVADIDKMKGKMDLSPSDEKDEMTSKIMKQVKELDGKK